MIVSHVAWHETRNCHQKSDWDFSFVNSSGDSISPCWLVLCRSKAFIRIQEDKLALKLFVQQTVQLNRSNGTFFLNLHRVGYTVFLILCLIKLTRVHEDSNIYIAERRIIKSVQHLWCGTLRDQDTLPWRQCVWHVRESNRVPFSYTVRKICFFPS